MIDRSKPLRFWFNGRSYSGHAGDTLASALLANGVRLVARSFKYHRPRGILSAGSEEPNALVTIGTGACVEPNTRATQVELFDGLVAHSQNSWPSLNFDLACINNLLSPLIPAGFYYKTFIGGPKGAWTNLYEPLIRRMAGLGAAPKHSDPDSYDKRHAHCDVLVIGAGPAGLAAARAAAAGGARVILVDERPLLGGSLLSSRAQVTTMGAPEWAASVARTLSLQCHTKLLTRTTAFGHYDHNLVMAVERLRDHNPEASGPRQRLWQIRAKHIILATGAHEQPLLFANNDRPGVMLASAAQRYAVQYGVSVGRCVVVATNNDSAYETVEILREIGTEIAAVVDLRDSTSNRVVARLDAAIDRVLGTKQVTGVEIIDNRGRKRRLSCDAVLMSGGWQPTLHLHCHCGGHTHFDDQLGCFVPGSSPAGVTSVGGCAGRFALSDCLADGHAAGIAAAARAGYGSSLTAVTADSGQACEVSGRAIQPTTPSKSFVDFQNDVTASDIDLAHREGFVSVEHLKRYTTTGMATDQGKTSNFNAISRMSERLNAGPENVGTTTFRPPYTPVTLGTIVSTNVGELSDPVRFTPMHSWQEANGAKFENVGQWKRAWYFPVGNESLEKAVKRECLAVRTAVGMFDASTLGKIDIQGSDAATLLNRVYTNSWSKLAVGRCRYGLMLTDDGMVMDDGVTTRCAANRYLMTTTTGNAARVMDHLEDLLQTEWPDLDVYLTSVTEHWAVAVVTGPNARKLLQRVLKGVDLSNDAFPHLSFREGTIGDIPVRLYRISFTGELSFEVHVSAEHGLDVWSALFAAGDGLGVTPYGTEATHLLRAEKGYIIIGQETDGTVTPIDLGMDWAISDSKGDFIGKRSLARTALTAAGRKQLVGLVPCDGSTLLDEGAQLIADESTPAPVPILGHITSAYWSTAVDSPIALALLKDGREQHGRTLLARSLGHTTPCRVCAPIFYDRENERIHA